MGDRMWPLLRYKPLKHLQINLKEQRRKCPSGTCSHALWFEGKLKQMRYPACTTHFLRAVRGERSRKSQEAPCICSGGNPLERSDVGSNRRCWTAGAHPETKPISAFGASLDSKRTSGYCKLNTIKYKYSDWTPVKKFVKIVQLYEWICDVHYYWFFASTLALLQ